MDFRTRQIGDLVPVRVLLTVGVVLYTLGFIAGAIAIWLVR